MVTVRDQGSPAPENAGVAIGVVGPVVNLPLLWYAAIYLPTTYPCQGFGF
jgi:hypothetical protein